MSWRTVIVANHSKLDLQIGFMQVRSDNETKRIILDEIDLVILESTAVSVTTALLVELIKRKIGVILCDSKRFPIAELVPYHGCHDSTRRLRMQLQWSQGAKELIWQKIVKEKITNQASLLQRYGKNDTASMLLQYVSQVQLGDKTNREGLAAKLYFPALFGDGFTREKMCDVNVALDYGYQVMLSVFARELSAEGYVTELGIFHNNVHNSYNLASDLIEPFRPLVDSKVLELFQDKDSIFDKEVRRAMVALLHEEIEISGNRQTIINAIVTYTRSITDGLNNCTSDNVRFPTYE
jgi:CRISPR-associated endonuclease Cas1 subtype II